ncbi:hypothetical protein BGZ95_011917 [Linnemannia exigua]|uniref:Potassium channel domain-containing protein n=1 Tax=Linnemannia exigua TaxID=604196 RepID=A0AAD4D980_9FUNG|nr:hypothetical protein BGZ95_011917 [Linnemannia exigua]
MEIHHHDNNNSSSCDPEKPLAAPQATASKPSTFLQSFRSKNHLQPIPASKAVRITNGKVPIGTIEFQDNYRIMPLAIGCIVPASILINVPSLTSEWVGLPVYDATTEKWGPPVEVPIPHWMSGMVIAALVMAIICNFCVLSRFLERHIWHSVVLSLITASLQEGFWSMVASLSFSATATVLISIDLHRTPQFRLQGSGVTHKQRMLIAQAMAFCLYLAIGALIFIWIEDWPFLESLFFAMITITTIGFGDIVPKTASGQVFVVFYASGGIVLFAMAVNAIRYVILEDLHRQFAIRAQERKAKKEVRRLERKEERIRELERRKNILGVVNNIQKANMLQDAAGTGPEPHQSSILRGLVNVPHGVTIHFSALFHRRGSGPIPKEEWIPGITLTDYAVRESNPELETTNKTDSLESSQLGILEGLYDPARRPSLNQGAADETLMDTDRHASTGTIGTTEISNHNQHQSFLKGLRKFIVRWYSAFGRACGFKEASNCAIIAAPMANLKKQRDADKKLAYKESMQEYRRRLRFSFAIFMCFWLLGAAIFQALEPWTYGQAMYFSFIAFSSIGYGDLVPLSLAGRAIFLAYCLIGVVTLTSLASLISEVLSKTLRRHVVQAQLRRTELFVEQGQGVNRRANDTDLEQGNIFAEVLENERSSEEGRQEERMQTLHTLASTVFDGQADESRSPAACQGSLRNLVQVSRDFDTLLQKVLGLDYASPDPVPTAAATSTAPESKTKAQVQLEPEKIVDFLEQEEEELSDSSCFGPSISRDVTSTSSIHRNSIATLGRNSLGPKSIGTYHGAAPSTASISSSELQFDIKSSPKASSTVLTKSYPDNERISPLQKQAMPPRLTVQPVLIPVSPTARPPSPATTHRHNYDGSVTISAIHWRHLVEYSKQFKVLTDSCDKALQKLLVWEVAETKMRLRRKQARERQRRLLQARRRRLLELGGTYGAIDDGIEDEDELEDLNGWFDDGSDADEDDGYEEDDEGVDTDDLDQDQERIARTLLGTINGVADPETRRSRSQVRRIGASVYARPRRSRSRSSVIAERADAQQHEGEIDIGASDGARDYSVNDPFITAAADPPRATERVSRTLYHNRGTREHRRSTSRSREFRPGHTPESPAEHIRGNAAALCRPPLHSIHTNEIPSHMLSDGDEVLIAVDDPLNPTRLCQNDPQSKHLFYVNTASGQRQWEHPNGPAASANDAAQFREQMNYYEQQLANYYRGGGYQQLYQQQQQQLFSQGGNRATGAGGAMGGVAVGLLAGTLIGSQAGNRRRRAGPHFAGPQFGHRHRVIYTPYEHCIETTRNVMYYQ